MTPRTSDSIDAISATPAAMMPPTKGSIWGVRTAVWMLREEKNMRERGSKGELSHAAAW